MPKNLIETIADEYNLILDHNISTYHLIEIGIIKYTKLIATYSKLSNAIINKNSSDIILQKQLSSIF